jgi:putative ABC transport system ATP-binding protein
VRLQHVGFVFQGFNLFQALTASQNVELALHLKGMSRRAAGRRAAELLEQVGLAAKRSAYPADLSGGQKQRVAIARALAGEPSIVLADEPTAALDWNSGLAIMRLLQDLAHQRGRAVVLVTHDSRVVKFADRIVHIEDGRTVGQPDLSKQGFPGPTRPDTEADVDLRSHELAGSASEQRT